MGRKAKELGALAISKIAAPGLHFVGGVSGLGLQVLPTGGRTWILRATVGIKRRDIGLGGYPDVTLARAREAAREARDRIKAGIDPIEHNRAVRSALAAAQGKAMTFKACAEAYIAAHEAGWRNVKHRQQWGNTLATFAYPKIGQLLVSDVEQSHVMQILDPIWRTQTETAKRLRGRIENVLSWATSRGLRKGENPADWKSLKTQLPAPNKIEATKPKHHAALSLPAMPAFMVALRETDGVGARALEFQILTAARSGEVLGAKFDEINLETKLWIIPGSRMKSGKEHRAALSPAAIALLQAMPRTDSGFVFASPRGGRLSDMSLIAVTRRMGIEAVPHGFRSTFRDWASERTNYPSEVAEMALSHAVGNKVEAAYRRGDLIEKRLLMMADWAAFCAKPYGGAVVSISENIKNVA